MRRNFLTPVVVLSLAGFALGCGGKKVTRVPEPQAACNAPKKLNTIGQCVECVANADCAVGQQCNLITGSCEAIAPPGVDGGHVATCQLGAVRCAPDDKSVQTCEATDGGADWASTTPCTGSQVCNPQTLTCAICIPGETECDRPDPSPTYERCKDDGTGFEQLPCSAVGDGFTCHQITNHVDPDDGGVSTSALATCRLCQPGDQQAVTLADGGGVGILTCDSTGNSQSFTSCYPTNQFADAGPGGPIECQLPVCYPGEYKCDNAPNTSPSRKACNADGSGYVQDDCTGGNVCGPTPNGDACLSPCDVAENSASYVGCDYWGVLASNTALDSTFTGNGNNPSEFGFVIGNTSPTLTATVTLTSSGGGGPYQIQVNPNSVGVIKAPWHQICGTGKAKFGYHLQSTAPVTVYQFNPLEAGVSSGGAVTYAYTNDASLLLPTHLLGTSYVVVAQDEETLYDGSSHASDVPLPGSMSIVATTDDTRVRIRAAGATLSTAQSSCPTDIFGNPINGVVQGGLGALTPNQDVEIALNKGDVLQYWNSPTGNPTCSSNGQDPFVTNYTQTCVWPSDFTGTIVTSVPGNDGVAKKIAVFGGADCTFKPYNKFACDHIEEEMFPFSTWGKKYVGVKTAKYAGSSSNYPDFWRLVAGCGAASCPNGTTITISPPISSARQSGICTTNGNTTTCHLPPVPAGGTAPWVEFQHNSSFYAESQQPFVLAQYFVSEEEAQSQTEGDPSLVLAPPVEQWRSDYSVLAPTTYAHNFVNLMVDGQNATTEIQVDGVTVPSSEWSQIGTTTFYAAVHPLSNAGTGAHTIVAAGGVKVGAVVYGYDSYVSYGYTGGLDLQAITGINPGG